MTGIFKKLSSLQILVIGYAVLILIFALLFTLPISTAKGVHQPFVDAMFVATSGISTSGLTVVDIGSYYTIFGQIILLIDFQIGGVGYMTFFAFLVYLFNRRSSLTSSIIAVESLAGPTLGDFKNFFKRVVVYTFFFEFIGAAFFALYWMRQFSITKAIYLGVFHSISTFCTAGFSLLPDSFMSYKSDYAVNMVINLLSLIGGIGFFVLNDLYTFFNKKVKKSYPRMLSVHSRMALVVSLVIILLSGTIILISEQWQPAMRTGDRLLISSFQAISASTTDGFNTIDIGAMNTTSLLMIIALMFIGASPGGTGGGIKTTTLGVMIASLRSTLNGKQEVNIFFRQIPDGLVKKSFSLFLFFVLVLIVDLMILTKTETASLLQILFEAASALGNTGMSMGITPNLSDFGKLLLTITMFVGRVGALTIGFALIGSSKPQRIKYAKGDLFVG